MIVALIVSGVLNILLLLAYGAHINAQKGVYEKRLEKIRKERAQYEFQAWRDGFITAKRAYANRQR